MTLNPHNEHIPLGTQSRGLSGKVSLWQLPSLDGQGVKHSGTLSGCPSDDTCHDTLPSVPLLPPSLSQQPGKSWGVQRNLCYIGIQSYQSVMTDYAINCPVSV